MGKVEINTEHINLQTDFGFKHEFGNIRKKEDEEIAYSQSLEKLRDTRIGINTDEAMCLSKKSLNHLDLNAILELDIPDIAKVYGGVRGRTMSSRHQTFAWPILKNAGIRTVIDLREDGCSSRLSQSCGKYGMDYFFFPVGQKPEAISTMVKLFPDFCEKIDGGNFYISCAMGLHRTDIALCTYWMFHGADRGMDAPEIKGYKKSEGHDINKAMHVLNAFYKCVSERDGQPPFSQDTFKQRKETIRKNADC